MMSDVILSPNSIAKLKTKDLVKKLKDGSPKFQEILRERCRERMREKRDQLFNKRRLCYEDPDELHNKITDILRIEFSSLTTSEIHKDIINDVPDFLLNIDDLLASESAILEEEEKWILAEYETMLQEEEKLFNVAIEEEYQFNVFCPMCQRAFLHENLNSINCGNCNFTFPAKHSLKNLKDRIDYVVDQHSSICSYIPSFTIVEENDINLYLICSYCNEIAFIA